MEIAERHRDENEKQRVKEPQRGARLKFSMTFQTSCNRQNHYRADSLS